MNQKNKPFKVVEKQVNNETIIGIMITEGSYDGLVVNFQNIKFDYDQKMVEYEYRILDKPNKIPNSSLYSPDLDELLKTIILDMIKTVAQTE